MKQLPLTEPVPENAVDFAVGIMPAGIAFIHNRVVTMQDGDQVLCPPGWDILFDGSVVMIVHTDLEVENA